MEHGNTDEPIPMVYMHPAMEGGGDSIMTAPPEEDSANGSSLDASYDLTLESSYSGAGDSFLSNLPVSPIPSRRLGKESLQGFNDSGFIADEIKFTRTPKRGAKVVDGARQFRGETSEESASSGDPEEHPAYERPESGELDQGEEQQQDRQGWGHGPSDDYGQKQASESS